MKKRILSAAVLIPVLFVLLYAAAKIVTAFVLSVLCAVAVFELLYNTALVRHVRLLAYTVLAAAMVPVWSYFGLDSSWAVAGLLLFASVMFMEMMISDLKLRFEKIAICFFAGIMLPYLLSALIRILVWPAGRYVILIPFVVGFLSDSGAYFVGCRFGKHKISSVISPNKSLEGVIGGVGGAVLGMMLYLLVMQLAFSCQVNYFYGILYAVIGSFMGVFGDLCFSAIKRQTGIKDFGNLIPGHGGVLDRFDSMLLVAPLMELLLAVIPAVVVK